MDSDEAMTPDATTEAEPIPHAVPLARSRTPTPKERRLIDFLLEEPYGVDALRAQARTARVVGTCSCGCPSVFLEVDPDTPTTAEEELPELAAYQVKSRGLGAQVTLHVVGGRLRELEIWAYRYGARPRVDAARLRRVQDVDWSAES